MKSCILRLALYAFAMALLSCGLCATPSNCSEALLSCGLTDQEIRCLDFVEAEVASMSCGRSSGNEDCITTVSYNEAESTITVSMTCTVEGDILGSHASTVFDCSGNVLQACTGFSFSFNCTVGDGLFFDPGREIYNCIDDGTLCENQGVDVTVCDDFDTYSLGNLSPQSGGTFTRFASTSGDATVVNSPSQSRNNSMWVSSNTDIDFNISQTIMEGQRARIEFAMYIPSGGSGEWGLETNNTNYGLRMQVNAGVVSIYSQQTLIASTTAGPANRWVDVAIIFQPHENEIELWWDNNFLAKLTNYQSNQITDVNFYGIDGNNNTSYYIDDICYLEWTAPLVTNTQYDPVCVNGEVYGNPSSAYSDGYTDNEWTAGECGAPGCTSLSFPANGAIDVPENVTLTWPAANDADAYVLTLGTSVFVTDILNQVNVGNTLSYTVSNLPATTTIYATVTPVNNVASASDCLQTRFTTESGIMVPDCSSLFFPSDGASNITTDVTIRWTPVSAATDYRMTVTADGASFLDITVISGTSYTLTDLPEGSNVCVTITPNNEAGSASGCSQVCFTTQLPQLSCTAITSPANNAQNVPTTVNITWDAVAEATFYMVKSTEDGSEFLNTNAGNVTSYILNDLPMGSTICVTVTPGNADGNASGCSQRCFTTASVSPPSCTTVTAPANNAQDIPTTVNMTWDAVADASGYLLEVRDAQGQTIISQTDVGVTTNYVAVDLPSNTFVCVTVTPYNDAGAAGACTATCFMTAMTTSTEEVTGSDLMLYPTTSSDYITIARSTGHSVTDKMGLNIYNSAGALVDSRPSYEVGSPHSVDHLSPGMYYAQLYSDGQVTSMRFIKL